MLRAGRRFLRTAVAPAVLMAALLGACGDDGGASAEPETTTPSTSTTTSTTTTEATAPVDPTVVPDEITEPYVQAVLDELYKLRGDALRSVHEEGSLTSAAIESLSAVYSSELLAAFVNDAEEAAFQGLDGFLRPPGDVIVQVQELGSARPDCLFVVVTQDFSAVVEDPIAPTLSGLVLRPATSEQQAFGNSTPWAIADSLFMGDGSTPEDGCDAQD